MRKIFLMTFALALVLAFAPAPDAAAGSCSAQQSCSDGSTVSCNGTSSCLVGTDYVECDGNRTSCPADSCSASYTCPTPEYDHDYRLFCSSSTGPCSVDTVNDSVTCGSTTRSCAGCQAGLYPCLYTIDRCQEGGFCSDSSDCGDGFCTSWNTCTCP